MASQHCLRGLVADTLSERGRGFEVGEEDGLEGTSSGLGKRRVRRSGELPYRLKQLLRSSPATTM